MIKYLIPFFFVGSAFAEPIQMRIDVSHTKLVHLTLYAKAAGTDKPPVLLFDATRPYTEQNQGIAKGLKARDLSSELLQTEGPIQVLHFDHDSRQHIECGNGIYQEKGSKRLNRINVYMEFSPSGISCMAEGNYKEMTEEEKTDDRSRVASLNEVE